MTTTPDIAALCRTLDAGDDDVLPILADVMEEAGDPRAAGLRRLGDRWPLRPEWNPEGSGWRWVGTRNRIQHNNWLKARIFRRLCGGVLSGSETPGPNEPSSRDYSSCSAAILALAEALS
jgi:hypothetical protein